MCLPMRYRIKLGDEVIEELRATANELRRNIGFRLDPLQSDLAGDVKKLKGGDDENRLRVGLLPEFGDTNHSAKVTAPGCNLGKSASTFGINGSVSRRRLLAARSATIARRSRA